MDLPASVQSGHAKEKDKTPQYEFRNFQKVTAVASCPITPHNTLVKLHNEAQVKIWLKDVIPSDRQPGGAISAGDCFFYSIADCLNQRSGKEEYSIQSLRIFCDEYVKDPKNSWVKDENIKDREDHNNYLVRIRFTAEELLAKEKAGQKLGLATWGRPKIEGRIFCEQYNIRIHVIQIQEDGDIHRYLIDSKGETNDYNPAIDYQDLNILHIINYHNHFVPLLNINRYIPEHQRTLLRTIDIAFPSFQLDPHVKQSVDTATIVIDDAVINEVRFGKRVTAGIYTNSAKALEHLPDGVAAIQRFGFLQPTSQQLLSTRSAAIGNLSVEKDIAASLVIDEQKYQTFAESSMTPPKVSNQYFANVMYLNQSQLSGAIKISELTQQLKRYYRNFQGEIKRVFGPPLPLDKCFVNLSIVKSREQRGNESGKLQFHPDRVRIYSSYEDIYSTNKKEVILPQDLFKERNKKIPKRIAVIGRAGIGKSTLGQYLTAYEWAANNRWQDKFDVVIKIQLRNLTKEYYDKNPSLVDIIIIECSDSSGTTIILDKADIEATLKNISERTLVILDGWDEFNLKESPCAKTISNLMKNLNLSIIVLSRPYTNLNTKDFELLLECIGFTTENIPEYINRVCEDKTKARLIISFLKRNPAIHSLAHIPIILDMICVVWDEEMSNRTEPMTMTELYSKLIAKLWKAYMEKQEEANPGIDIEKLHQKKEKAKDFLSLLAFRAMESNTIMLSYQQIENAIKETYRCSDEDVERKLKEILAAGFLNSSDNIYLRGNYYFSHLTIQEYLAALHWVKLFTSINKTENEFTEFFLKHNKYNPRFEIVWWFVAGILRNSEEGLNKFFNFLLDTPRDITGFADLLLWVRCLDEAGGISSILKIKNELLTQTLWWVTTGLHQKIEYSESWLKYIIDVLSLSPGHLKWEKLRNLFLNTLENDDYVNRRATSFALGHLSQMSLKDTLPSLLNTLANDVEVNVRMPAQMAIKDIAKHDPFTSYPILLEGLKFGKSRVKVAVIEAFGELAKAVPDAVYAILSEINCASKKVRETCATELSRFVDSQPQVVFNAILKLIKDKNWKVRRMAVRSLGWIAHVNLEIALENIFSCAQDEDGHVKGQVGVAFGSAARAGAKTVISYIFSKIRNGDQLETYQVVTALNNAASEDFKCSFSGLLTLAEFREDESFHGITHTLASIYHWEPEISKLYILTALKHTFWRVRYTAAKVISMIITPSDEHYNSHRDGVQKSIALIEEKIGEEIKHNYRCCNIIIELIYKNKLTLDLSTYFIEILILLNDQNNAVRGAALNAITELAEIDLEKSLQCSIKFIYDSDLTIRCAALRLMQRVINYLIYPPHVIKPWLDQLLLKQESKGINQDRAIAEIKKIIQRGVNFDLKLSLSNFGLTIELIEKALFDAMGSDNSQVRYTAYTIIGEIGIYISNALLAKLWNTNEEDSWAKWCIIKAASQLARFFPDDAYKVILSGIRSGDIWSMAGIRSVLIKAIKLYPETLAVEFEFYLNKKGYNRAKDEIILACGLAGKICPEIYMPILSKAFKDENVQVRNSVVNAWNFMAKSGVKTAIDELLFAMEDDNDSQVSSIAASCLKEFNFKNNPFKVTQKKLAHLQNILKNTTIIDLINGYLAAPRYEYLPLILYKSIIEKTALYIYANKLCMHKDGNVVFFELTNAEQTQSLLLTAKTEILEKYTKQEVEEDNSDRLSNFRYT